MKKNNEVLVENGNKKSGRAVKTVAVMMGATVIAKLLGMLRGVLQANAYGTTEAANAFTAASKLPLTFFDMFLAAAVLGCFIPVYNSFKEKDADGEVSRESDDFACIFLNFIVLMCGVLALVGIVFAEPFIRLITNGLAESTVTLAVSLTRIMFPMVIFTGAAYTLVGVLQSKGSFIAPALISAISNAGVVLYLAFFNSSLGEKGIYGLAVAYLLSWLLQLVTLIIPLIRRGFRYRPILDFRNPALIRAIKMTPPIMIGSWLAPAGTLLGQYFAAGVTASGGISGATTVFDYANNVYIIIAGILTYSICNYTFPKIARLASGDSAEELAATVGSSLTSALFITVPFMAAALVLSGEGVSVLYMRGEFTADDARNTAYTLRFILAAMPFFCVTELLSRMFYAKNMPRTPMYAALGGIAANLTAGVLLTSFGNIGIGAVGLANAIGQAVAALILVLFAIRYVNGLFNKSLVIQIIKIIIGGGITIVSCAVMSELVKSDPYTAGLLTNTVKALVIFVPSAGLYLIFGKLSRIRFFYNNK